MTRRTRRAATAEAAPTGPRLAAQTSTAEPYDVNDVVVFAREDVPAARQQQQPEWLVLIVDDEEEIHSVTKLALADVAFKGRPIRLLDAYSQKDTLRLMHEHPDIAVILLDIVMEDDDSGLKIIRHIRNEMQNSFVRIVIRTAQPGQAPERNVIVDYDINDYKEKAELTSQKLFSTVIALLRSYDNLMAIEYHRSALQMLVEVSNTIFGYRSVDEFAAHALEHVFAILASKPREPAHLPDSLLALRRSECFVIAAAHGRFASTRGKPLDTVLTPEDAEALAPLCGADKEVCVSRSHLSYCFASKTGTACVIYMANEKLIGQSDASILQLLLATLASAFDSICLDSDIVTTHNELLMTLGQVVEARSNETGNHVRRVAEYSKILARRLGLSDYEADLLRQAAALHDIGKVGVLDSILNKPTRLDATEYDAMKTHTTIGHDIFKGSTRRLFQVAAIVALQHHERYDGHGYPHGLHGDDIHLYGRIVSLADVFDAVGSSRQYKQAWEMDDILRYLREESGRSFDPKLIEVFFANLEEILQVRERFRDA